MRGLKAREFTAGLSLQLASWIPVAIAAFILAFIMYNGLGVISWDFITGFPIKGGLEGGILPAIIGSIYVSVVCMLVAVPLGMGAGIYLAEYAPDNVVTRTVRFFIEILAGIPSIVIGLFGYIFLVHGLKLGFSVLAGGLALAFMILPWTVRVSEEAIAAVPKEYRYASLALGATKWDTIRRALLPAARPMVITGMMLGLGKAVGETAVVMMTAGMGITGYLPISPLDPARTLPVHLYMIAGEIAYTAEGLKMAYGTALVLLLLFLLVSVPALFIRNYLIRRGYGIAI
ncbi:MAG: phosphate ABC transporter permease PstA [Nitrososphaerota archaeon]|nr:phosphate ABC transporter permease PstA [Nitrososphaerota archaeon]